MTRNGYDVPSASSRQPCHTNTDCDDGLFCNGQEFCAGSVCAALSPPSCDDGIACTTDTCSEQQRACTSQPPDADHDGAADASCRDGYGVPLGTDCDDGAAGRFPGNTEVCDANDVDEDCDPSTNGGTDADGDGLTSAECCNDGPDGLLCGNDCDDSNFSIVTGSQVCNTTGGVAAVLICRPDGVMTGSKCSGQGTCAPQPNGLGVCIP